MNLAFSTYLALVLTLLPVAAVLVTRARPQRPLWSVGLDVPAALAADMILVLLMARFVRLDLAIVVSRGIWLSVLCEGAWTQRKRGLLAWPVRLRDGSAISVALAATLGTYLSRQVSRPYRIGDHNWHDGLVPTIAAQKLPFVNVYDPTVPFHYHITGDVFGAIIRTLSGNVMSSALAIALVRDVSFALIGVSVTLIALGLAGRHRRVLSAVFAGLLFLMHGPIALHAFDAGSTRFHGYAYDSFLLASCRPHMAFSGLLIVGFCGAVVGGLARPNENRRARLATLLVTTTILGISDEASLAALGLGLGAAWVVQPTFLTRRRRTGALVLLGLGVAIVFANGVFQGALTAGANVDLVEWLPARVPSVTRAPDLPLSLPLGRSVFRFEVLPFVIGFSGITVHAWQVRKLGRGRAQLALLSFAAVVVLLSMKAATTIQVNGSSGENQRFFVAPMFAILLACVWQEQETSRGSVASLLMLGALFLPATTTLFWLRERSHDELRAESSADNPAMPENLYEIECRKSAGASFRARPGYRYIESSQYFYYLSCRPVFAAGAVRAPWKVKLAPLHGVADQFFEVNAHVPPEEPLFAICRSGPTGPVDAVCEQATKHPERCKPEGTRFVQCSLQPDERRELERRGYGLQRPKVWPR